MPWSKVRADTDEPDFLRDSRGEGRRISHAEAIRESFDQALTLDPATYLMGQGVNDPGGMFGTCSGLVDEHGADRVFDTPLAENGMTGIAIGSAIVGMRPIYLHNRPDFLFLALDQIANHAAKWSFMTGGAVSVPLVLWACIGRGWGSAAQHSQALQGTFMHLPGLKLVMPSTGHDAKGLLHAALKDPNPVLILEHRFNFKLKGIVPEAPYTIPIGKGILRRQGRDLTIVTISQMVHEAHAAADRLAGEGIEVEIVDLRSLRPLDESLVLESLARTGRLVIADHGWKTCGITAEIGALAAEKGYHSLRAPIERVCAPDMPTPAGYTLEQAFYQGQSEIVAAARRVVSSGQSIDLSTADAFTAARGDEEHKRAMSAPAREPARSTR